MEKPKKTISPDYIQSKLKQGWTMQDFCKDLEISEDSLLEFIEKHSNNRIYAAFPRQVKQNEQLAEKRRRSEEKKLNVADKNNPENVQASTSAANKKEKTIQTPNKETIEVDPILSEIDSLNNKIKIKESDLTGKINLKMQLASEQDHLTQKISNLEDTVERLTNELKTAKQSLSKANHRITVITSHMSSVEQDIVNIEDIISSYKLKIRELQKITVLVCLNGDIIIDKKVEIPKSWEEKYSKLRDDTIVEDITVKQVKQLAKLLVLFEKLNKEGEYFEFIFENDSSNASDSVKTLFELLTEKSK